jgi:hypothetical protein
MEIFKYNTEDEAQAIIAKQTAQGLVLSNVANITEGNFLGFMESEKVGIITNALPEQLAELKEQVLTLMDAVATLYETVSGGTTA